MPPVIRQPGVVVVACLAAICVASAAGAQVLTFVQVSAPHLYGPWQGRGDGAALLALRNQLALLQSILAINALARERSVDLAVLSGDLGVTMLSDQAADGEADKLASALKVFAVRRIAILAGETDVSFGDPNTRTRFDRFVARIRQGLPPETDFVDLTRASMTVNGIRVVGLDSAPFVSSAGRAGPQRVELQKLGRAIGDAPAVVVFTHAPPMSAPDDKESRTIVRWNVALQNLAPLQQMFGYPTLLAVFGGHVITGAADMFVKEQRVLPSLSSRGPSLPLWVAPALGQSSSMPEQRRGFLFGTVNAQGGVTAAPHWLTDTDVPRDKESLLVKGGAHLAAWELTEAITAFEGAMASTDASVRAAAEYNFLRARDAMRSWRWRFTTPVRWIRNFWEVVVVAVALILALAAWTFERPPVIVAPVKLVADAPAELFVAELLAAIPEAQRSLRAEGRPGEVLGEDTPLARPMALGEELTSVINALPDLGPLKTGGFVKAVMSVLGVLRRRIIIEVSGSKDNTRAFGTLTRAGITHASWRSPSEDDETLDVTAAARQMAYNILWELRKRKKA